MMNTKSATKTALGRYTCPDPAEELLELNEAQQNALAAYIKSRYKPGKRICDSSSYGLKHLFEESENGFYVTNGQFKGAMLLAGFIPTKPFARNWLFKIDSAQPCAGRLKDKSSPYGSNPCYHKPDPLTGLCPYHADRKARRLPLDTAVYPDRESWLAATDARRGIK